MSKSISVIQKKRKSNAELATEQPKRGRGRPPKPGGVPKPSSYRLDPGLLSRIFEYRKRRVLQLLDEGVIRDVSESEAVAELLDIALQKFKL
jgi:hypothetical protein